MPVARTAPDERPRRAVTGPLRNAGEAIDLDLLLFDTTSTRVAARGRARMSTVPVTYH
jgi:hypothetical protein